MTALLEEQKAAAAAVRKQQEEEQKKKEKAAEETASAQRFATAFAGIVLPVIDARLGLAASSTSNSSQAKPKAD